MSIRVLFVCHGVFKGRGKILDFIGFLDGSVEFTPYLHLWKIGSVSKTYGNYKRFVLKTSVVTRLYLVLPLTYSEAVVNLG